MGSVAVSRKKTVITPFISDIDQDSAKNQAREVVKQYIC
jgi:hypothetical protein